MKSLDFIIIGAQKSGTTTLFELLKQHHDLYFPPEKELPFFGGKAEANGWDWYMNEYFYKENIDKRKLWGTATPLYMSSEEIAGKLFSVCPNTKLIAILRDPFERAYSHYQMSVKRGRESRSFIDASKELLTPEKFNNARKNPTVTSAYFAWSEYGRILKSYLQYYKKENILILSMDDLEHNPKVVLDKICAFLNIAPFTPGNLTKKFHQGGTKRKLSIVDKLIKNKIVKKTVKKIVGGKSKRSVQRWLYWLDQWNTKKGSGEKDKVNIYLKELMDPYYEDAMILEQEFDFKAPWIKNIKQ